LPWNYSQTNNTSLLTVVVINGLVRMNFHTTCLYFCKAKVIVVSNLNDVVCEVQTCVIFFS